MPIIVLQRLRRTFPIRHTPFTLVIAEFRGPPSKDLDGFGDHTSDTADSRQEPSLPCMRLLLTARKGHDRGIEHEEVISA